MKLLKQMRGSVIKNMLSLGSIDIINTLLPLITYPYLLNVLGSEIYGNNIFLLGFGSYLLIILNFGFELSLVPLISRRSGSRVALSRIVTSAYLIKIALLISSLILSIPILFFVSSETAYLLGLILIGVIGQTFTPSWFFQGVSKMHFITWGHLVGKLFYLIMVFACIQRSGDADLMLLLMSASYVIIAIIGNIILWRRFSIKISSELFKMRYVMILFRHSSQFFASKASVSLFTHTNSLIIGLVIGKSEVALYDLAVKIVNVGRLPLDIVNRILYPIVAKVKDNGKVIKALVINVAIAAVMVLGIYYLVNPVITMLLKPEMLPSESLTKLYSLSLPLVGVHVILGVSVMIVRGYSKQFNFSILLGGALNLALLLICYLTGFLTLYNIVLVRIAVELFMCCYRGWFVYSKGLLNE